MRRPSVEVVLSGLLALVVGGAVAIRITSDRKPTNALAGSSGVFGSTFSAGMCLGFAGSSGGPLATETPDTSSVAGLAQALEEIRELKFRELPEPRLLSPTQMADEVREAFAADYPDEEAQDDERILAMLGAIPPGTDLRTTLSGFVEEQVTGFYDPDTGDLVVEVGGGELSPTEKITLAHELDHALTDQVLGIPLEEPPAQGQEDAALAVRALAEGDATLAMSMFASRALSLEEQLSADLASFPGQDSLTVMADVPHHLVRTMTFPYLEGLVFVCDLQVAGGWEAVDRAYDEPPATTAQILFPERYRAGEGAIDARDPGNLGGGWTLADVTALGAADLLFLFEAPGGDPTKGLRGSLDLAAAWAGGEMTLWTSGGQSALGVALVQRVGEPSLCVSVGRWYDAAFEGRQQEARPGETLAVDGDVQDAVLRCAGGEVRLGIGPDLETARSLVR